MKVQLIRIPHLAPGTKPELSYLSSPSPISQKPKNQHDSCVDFGSMWNR